MDSSSYPSIARIRATVKRYVSDYLTPEYIDKLFSGVMGLEDFADYVTYEACIAQYVKNERQYALLHHVNNVYHSHLDYLANSNHQSGKIKTDPGFSPESLYRGIYTYLKDMAVQRASDLEASGLTGTGIEKVPVNYLDLLYYDSKEANKQREGFPLATSHFLQVYTSYVLGIKNEKFLKRLSNKNFGIPEAESYYELQDAFLKHLTSAVFDRNMTDEACELFIANSINLTRYEKGYFRNTIYSYAASLSKSKSRPSYLTGSIPPILLDSIITHPVLMSCVFSGFLSMTYVLKMPHVSNMNVKKPYLLMNQYAQIFASSDRELSQLEEYRYLSIQILATDILNQLLNDPTLPAVGLQELACFTHDHYNIAQEMNRQANIHKSAGFTQDIVSTMRATVRELQNAYGLIERK